MTTPRTAAAAYFDFGVLPPDEVSSDGSRTWITRGQNAALAVIDPIPGCPLEPTNLAAEHLVLLPSANSAARFVTDGNADAATHVRGPAIVIVPPGLSQIEPDDVGHLVRLVDHLSPGWTERSRNADDYRTPHANVAPLEYWPEPDEPHRLRTYLIADVKSDPSRFGRIFRSRAFMVNFLQPHVGPRDRALLSPHHHDDFEQFSLAVNGEFIHHIRTPWSKNANDWREDEHYRIGSPSLAIIPPPAVHTSEAIGPNTNQLIDIFCPPRTDFSLKQGWVLNSDEYPMP